MYHSVAARQREFKRTVACHFDLRVAIHARPCRFDRDRREVGDRDVDAVGLGWTGVGPHARVLRVYGRGPCEPPFNVAALSASGSGVGSPKPAACENASIFPVEPAVRTVSPDSQ